VEAIEYKFGTPSAMLVGDPRSVTKMISSTQLDRDASLVSRRRHIVGVNPRRQGTGVQQTWRAISTLQRQASKSRSFVRRWGFIVFWFASVIVCLLTTRCSCPPPVKYCKHIIILRVYHTSELKQIKCWPDPGASHVPASWYRYPPVGSYHPRRR
jgi:hypothetical protein